MSKPKPPNPHARILDCAIALLRQKLAGHRTGAAPRHQPSDKSFPLYAWLQLPAGWEALTDQQIAAQIGEPATDQLFRFLALRGLAPGVGVRFEKLERDKNTLTKSDPQSGITLSLYDDPNNGSVVICAVCAFGAVPDPKPPKEPKPKPEKPPKPEKAKIARAKSDFTPRELEILPLAVAGKTCPEIASLWHRSVSTVKNTKHGLYSKLGVSNVAELIEAAYRNGLIAGGDARALDPTPPETQAPAEAIVPPGLVADMLPCAMDDCAPLRWISAFLGSGDEPIATLEAD